MRINLNSKKVFYKKIVWVILVMLFCGMLGVTNNEVNAEVTPITGGDEIKILEIEPGNKYRVTNISGSSKILRNETIEKDTTIKKGSSNLDSIKLDKKVNITHITMAEFISMVDEIRGQYDVVVVGRKNNELKSKYSEDEQYRDYTNPSSQLMQGLRYSKAGKSIDFNLPADTNPKLLDDGRNYVEYYSENDITEKRAKEIQAMIKSNQLVYMEDSIFNSTGDKEITKTKLYNLFNIDKNKDLEKYNNFKIDKAENIYLYKIISDYNALELNLKRPVIEVTKPTDDKAYDKGELYRRYLDFKIKSNKEDKLKINIYLDVNADGLFKDTELYKSKEILFTSSTIQEMVSCNLDKEFIGQLDWKVEAIRENADTGVVTEIKTNVISNSVFKPVNEKRKIKVLQINPLTDTEQKADNTNISLDNNTKNTNTNEDFKKFIKELQGYELEIDCISYDVFNKTLEAINETVGTNNKNQKIENIEGSIKELNDIQYKRKIQNIVADLKSGTNYSTMPDVLNGSYNMVIIGFADNYNDSQIGTVAIQQLHSYIETGQSVMFTHDTMSYNSIENLDIDRGPKALAQHFRDYLGQSIYQDPLRLNSGDNTTHQDSIPETDIYKESTITRDNDGNIIKSELKEKNIVHKKLDLSNDDKINNRYTLGTTLRSIPLDTTSTPNQNISQQSVKSINGAQITSYPFNLTENAENNTNEIIRVSRTHTQWYQLNLEDPEVVPWYNLNSDDSNISKKFDTGDSKNYYYTYSRGNLTYSGTGHSNGYTEDEFKLFINTVIKAERGGNHPPNIKSSIANEFIESQTEALNSNTIASGSNYIFTMDADDIEHEIVDIHVTIDGAELTSLNIGEELKDRKANGDSSKVEKIFKINTADSSKSPIRITIPKSKLPSVGGKVLINVDATDSQGAKKQKKYMLITTEAPIINSKAYLSKLTVKDSKDPQYKEEKLIDQNQAIVDNMVNVKENQYVNAEYTINVEDNPIEDKSPSRPEELAILIDRSMDKGALTQIRNGFFNSLLNMPNVKFSILPYNRGKIRDYVNDLKIGNGPSEYPQQAMMKIYDEGASDTIEPGSEGLDKALQRAKEFFEKNDQSIYGKTILIISKTDLSDMDKDKFQTLLKSAENFNCNVVTIGISKNSFNDPEDDKSQLKVLHEKLGGSKSSYYLSNRNNPSDSDDQSGTNNHNDIESPLANVYNKSIMSRVGDDVEGFRKNLFLRDVRLEFDLGKDIKPTEASNLIKIDENINSYKYKVNIDQLKLIADYYIDKSGNFMPSEDLLDEIVNNVLANINKSNEEQNNELKDMLNTKLKEVFNNKLLESDDVVKIINIINEDLNKKVSDEVELIGIGDTKNKLLTDVQDKTVKEVLNSDATDAVKNVMKDILKINMSDTLNKKMKQLINNGGKDKIKNTIHYSSEKTKINFNIKPVVSPSTDKLEFTAEKNKFIYNDVLNNMQEYKIIKTPILQVDIVKIDHGLYRGLSKNLDQKFGCIKAITKDEKDPPIFTIPKDSIVTLASNINGMTAKTNIELRVKYPNCTVTEKPKAYIVKTTDGKTTMEKICDFSEPYLDNIKGENVYKKDEFDGLTYKNIVILYSVQTNENYTEFTNIIKANSKEVPIKIKINNSIDSLPDLF